MKLHVYKSKYKKVGVLPIRIVKSNVSRVGPSSERDRIFFILFFCFVFSVSLSGARQEPGKSAITTGCLQVLRCFSLRHRPKFEIIWVCESPAIIMYSDVAIFPRFEGKRDVTHLIYVKIKPYHFLCCFGKDSVSDEIKFQNASKRQIKIIYFYVIKMPLYTIIAGDLQTDIISNLGLGRKLRCFNVRLTYRSFACANARVEHVLRSRHTGRDSAKRRDLSIFIHK